MIGLIRQTIRRAREERLAQAAGSLTFTTVLSVVPLLAVSFALFLRVPAFKTTGLAIRQHLLQGLLPPEMARMVIKHLSQFAANTGGLTWMGALFVLASALALLLNTENVLNRIFLVKKPRPWHKRLGLYAAMLVLGAPLLGASLWATSYLLTAAATVRVVPMSPEARFVLNLLPVALGTVGLAGLFYFVPNAKVRRRDAILGGLLASIAFELGKRAFAVYLLKVPTYQTVYGGFAPVLLFLVWVYFSWLVTLAAALVAATMPRAGKQPTRRLSRA